MTDREPDISKSVASISRAGLTGPPEEIIEEYVKEVLHLQLDYAELQQEIQDISIDPLGLLCRRKLSSKGDELSSLLDRTTLVQSAIHDSSLLVEFRDESVDPVSESAQDQLEIIRSEGLYEEIARIEALREEASRLYQHKLDTANTYLGLVISVIAVVAAAGTLVYTMLTGADGASCAQPPQTLSSLPLNISAAWLIPMVCHRFANSKTRPG